jgi:hypothetical protein
MAPIKYIHVNLLRDDGVNCDREFCCGCHHVSKSVSQSVIKQIGATPIFTRCGRATLTPVLEYLVTEPPLNRGVQCLNPD